MQQLEPTYLRYVYDGLSKGSISPNNPTSLPIGFIGLFEDEFPSSMPVIKRVSILNRLALWALLKGPVSAEMVAEILDENPDTTKALIDKYSKWFNSPEPGKYVLYHDRLRTYLLQKLSDNEVQKFNERLISYLDNAYSSEGLKEAESYALEHLSTHMVIESQMGNNYERLHEFVNKEALWKRQVKVSKEYKWSQQAVQYGIKEGSRRHNEMNTLISTVNSVKLTREEQSNVRQILGYLKDGDYETSLIRTESLPSNNKIKFTVYLLMIHELTIGECKSSYFTLDALKEVIEKIKNDNLKPPHLHFNSITNKNKDSYSGYLIYVYYLEIKKRELECDVLFDKILWDGEDFLKIAQFNKVEVKQLIDSIDYLKDDSIYYKSILICYFFYHLEIENTDKNTVAEKSSNYFKKYINTNKMYASFSYDQEYHPQQILSRFCKETQQMPLYNPKSGFKPLRFNKSLNFSREKIYTYLKEIILIVFKDRKSYLFIDDKNKTDIIEEIFKIINIYNLNKWIRKEKLFDLVFKDISIFCSKNPEFSVYYAVFLTREGKIKQALDFLRKIEDDYSIDDPYRYTYGGGDINISYDSVRANLISYDFTNDFQLIINNIKNDQIKSLAYLSLIYMLNKNYDNTKIEKCIVEIRKSTFNLEDLEQGRTTDFNDYEQNIYLSLLLSNFYFKIGMNSEGLIILNQTYKLIDTIHVRIFENITLINIRKKYQFYSHFLRIANFFGYEIKQHLESILSNVIKLEKAGLGINILNKKINDILDNDQKTKIIKLMVKFPESNMHLLSFEFLHEDTPVSKVLNINDLFGYLDIINDINEDTFSMYLILAIKKRIESYEKFDNILVIKNKIELNSEIFKNNMTEKEYEMMMFNLNNNHDKSSVLLKIFDVHHNQIIDSLEIKKDKVSAILTIKQNEKLKRYFEKPKKLKKKSATLKSKISSAKTGDYLETELLINKFKSYVYKSMGSESEINNLIDSILISLSKLKISEKSELKFLFIPLIFYYDQSIFENILSKMNDEYDLNDGGDLKDKRDILVLLSFSILKKVDELETIYKLYDWEKRQHFDYYKNNLSQKKTVISISNLAIVFLEKALKYSFNIHDKLDIGSYADNKVIILTIVKLLCDQNSPESIVSVAKQFEDLFLFKKLKKKEISFIAPITKIEMPKEILYDLFVDIGKYLYKSRYKKESFEIINIIKEKNIIAQFYIFVMKDLNENSQKNLAFNYQENVLDLIETSLPLPTDNSPWPLRGISLLYLSEFYYEIQDYEKCEKIIEKAIEEIDLKAKNIIIEKIENIQYSYEYSTHFNEYNLDNFRSACIHSLLKIGLLDKAKEMWLEINPILKIDNYDLNISYLKAKGTDYYGTTKMIALKIAENNPVDAIEFILGNSNISDEQKFNFSKLFLSRVSYDDNIKLFRKSFQKFNLLNLFIDCLSAIFWDSPNLKDEFKYLSSFTNHINNQKTSSELNSNCLLNITYARLNDYCLLIKEKENNKINILYQLFYNDFNEINQ